MAGKMIELQPLPEPGVAIFPRNLSTDVTKLVMRGKPESTSWAINFADGSPFLAVKSPTFTMSSRKHITDAKTNKKLCDFRSKPFSRSKTYYAEAPDGSTLLELTSKALESKFLSNGGIYETTMKFANAAANGASAELQMKGNSFDDLKNEVTCNGVVCGVIDEKFRYSKGEYILSVAPGLDPFVIAALAVALDEKETEDELGRVSRITNSQGNAGATSI